MKVFLDTTPLITGHQGRGIGIYTKNLITALKKYQFLGVQSGQAQAGGYECDIIHYPYFDFFFHTLPFKKPAKTIVTIHDVIPLIFKQQVPPGVKGSFRFKLQHLSLLNVAAIITDSQNSKVDIQKYLHIPPSKIFVVPLAVDQDFKNALNNKTTHLQKLPKKYFLYVGDINYNKNIPSLIKAFSNLKNQTDLVIVSRALTNRNLPESQAIIQEISHSAKKGKIHLLTNIDHKILPSLYQHAQFYIQPSLYEGFGLPILEAFQAGTPVLSSQASSLPEVAGNGALYFDPSNIDSMTQTMHNALNLSNKQRQYLIQNGYNQLQKFSWQEVAKQTITVYKHVIKQ